VIEGVVADEVTRLRDARRRFRKGLDPAALQEERRADLPPVEEIEEALLDARGRRSIWVLGVEREGDPEAVYFSTPVITMPRTKKRWKIRNMTTGMSIVITVPAWIRFGFALPWIPLKRASPTARGCRSSWPAR
jgi:hypothetical protein